jgi:hypothetical protein
MCGPQYRVKPVERGGTRYVGVHCRRAEVTREGKLLTVAQADDEVLVGLRETRQTERRIQLTKIVQSFLS